MFSVFLNFIFLFFFNCFVIDFVFGIEPSIVNYISVCFFEFIAFYVLSSIAKCPSTPKKAKRYSINNSKMNAEKFTMFEDLNKK